MFTVKQFTKLKQLKSVQVATCNNRLENRPIDYISVIETPVDDFVRKNELVLTTAKGCATNALVFNLINDVYLSEAAALVIAYRGNNLKLSNTVLTYFEERDFPIIIIPWEIRFGDLLDTVLKNIRDNTLGEIKFYEDIQNKLLKSYLQNDDLLKAAKILAKHFKSDVAILDLNYDTRAYSNSKFIDYTKDLWRDLDLIKIHNDERNYGYIYFELNSNSIIYNLPLINRYFLICLILWFDREWIIYATHQNAKDNFVAKLTKKKLESNNDLNSHAILLGFNIKLPYTCIIGKLSYRNDNEVNDIVILDDWIYDKWLNIQSIMIESAKLIKLKIMFTYKDNSFIIYLSNAKNNPQEKIHQFLDILESKFDAEYSNVLFSWGISEVNNELYQFENKFENALLAQKLCDSHPQNTRRFTYKNTLVYNLINHISQDSKISADLYNVIYPLIDYDKKNDTQLTQTLKVYLQSHNASQSAIKLHLHRQSLLYRLSRIEEVLGLSLKDYENTYLLETALRLHFNQISEKMG